LVLQSGCVDAGRQFSIAKRHQMDGCPVCGGRGNNRRPIPADSLDIIGEELGGLAHGAVLIRANDEIRNAVTRGDYDITCSGWSSPDPGASERGGPRRALGEGSRRREEARRKKDKVKSAH
jgi:predicted  nucleic acid-binding Zn-ribbon protein